MKKIAYFLSFLIVFIMIFSCLTGCTTTKERKEFVVVCTVFPVYDWMRNVVGENDNVDIVLLLDDGLDLHNFQPTMDDMAVMSDCDVFIYVGGESDDWVDDVLTTVKNTKMTTVNLIEVLGDKAREEEEIEGAEDAHEHEHEHEEEETGYDEHVWLSLKNAEIFVKKLADVMAVKDEKNAEKYQRNAAIYNESLSELDAEYEKAVGEANVKTLVFADRFPFLYLFKDYGLQYFAAFSGCSTETSASPETVAFLAGKLNELNLRYILQIEGQTHDIAISVRDASESKNQTITSLNSLQTITANDVNNGVTYLSVMQSNLETLKTVLKNGG